MTWLKHTDVVPGSWEEKEAVQGKVNQMGADVETKIDCDLGPHSYPDRIGARETSVKALCTYDMGRTALSLLSCFP